MKKRILLPTLWVLILLFTACGKKEVRLTADQYPVCRGDVIASRIVAEAMCTLSEIPMEEARGYTLLTDHTAGYEELLAGSAQLVFSTRMPGEEELEAAKEAGITLEVTPIARDALVFITHEKNPVRSLTKAELAEIYAGTITDWRSMSGNNEEIIAYQRPDGDLYHSLLAETIMQDTPFGDPPISLVANISGDPLLFSLSNDNSRSELASYTNTPGAIYYGSRYYFAGTEEQNGIRLLSVEGAAPSLKNIQNGKYDLTYDLYAILRSDSRTGSAERVLLDWFLSKEGQELVKEVGYVPVA